MLNRTTLKINTENENLDLFLKKRIDFYKWFWSIRPNFLVGFHFSFLFSHGLDEGKAKKDSKTEREKAGKGCCHKNDVAKMGLGSCWPSFTKPFANKYVQGPPWLSELYYTLENNFPHSPRRNFLIFLSFLVMRQKFGSLARPWKLVILF